MISTSTVVVSPLVHTVQLYELKDKRIVNLIRTNRLWQWPWDDYTHNLHRLVAFEFWFDVLDCKTSLLQSNSTLACCNRIQHRLVAVEFNTGLLQSNSTQACCNRIQHRLVAVEFNTGLLQSNSTQACCNRMQHRLVAVEWNFDCNNRFTRLPAAN